MSTIETLTKERDELLSRVKYLDEVREFNETTINGLSCKLNAANARCEQLRSELEAARGKVGNANSRKCLDDLSEMLTDCPNQAFVSVMMEMIEDYAKAVHDGADDHAANLRHVVKASLEQIPQLSRFLLDSDQKLLRRFIETAEDDESFDIGMPAVKRLADLGVVRNCGFGRYAVTMFGYWVHEHCGYRNPPLPLMTNSERDAAQKAKLTVRDLPHP